MPIARSWWVSGGWNGAVGVITSIWLRIVDYFPLVVLKGIYHYWKYIYIYIFFRALKQMEDYSKPGAGA